MNGAGIFWLHLSAGAGMLILTSAMALVVYRIAAGPESADRIIALDLFSILVVALIALLALATGEKVLLDVAVAYALVAFLGTVAYARYLERSRPGPENRPGWKEGPHD